MARWHYTYSLLYECGNCEPQHSTSYNDDCWPRPTVLVFPCIRSRNIYCRWIWNNERSVIDITQKYIYGDRATSNAPSNAFHGEGGKGYGLLASGKQSPIDFFEIATQILHMKPQCILASKCLGHTKHSMYTFALSRERCRKCAHRPFSHMYERTHTRMKRHYHSITVRVCRVHTNTPWLWAHHAFH